MTRVQRPFRPIWCLKHSSGIGLLAWARRLLDTSAVPMSKSCATFKKVACCAANQCLKGAASSCIGEEATLNCNFTYKLLYIDAGNRQNYTRRCPPPFFLQRGCTEWRYKWANSHWPFLRSITGRNVYTLSNVQSSPRARCVVVREMNSSLLGRIRGSEAILQNQSKCGWCVGRSRAMRCMRWCCVRRFRCIAMQSAYSETREVPCAYMPYKSQAAKKPRLKSSFGVSLTKA